MFYQFECEKCNHTTIVQRSVADRNKPLKCPKKHLMRRVISKPYFTANLEKDKPENQLYRVLTKSNSREDWLRRQREDEARYASKEAKETPLPPSRSMDDILSSGIVEAARSSKEAVQRWREDNIPKDDFAIESGEE